MAWGWWCCGVWEAADRAAGLPRYLAAGGRAGGRSGAAHDACREDRADHDRRARRSRGWASRATNGGTRRCTAWRAPGGATVFPQAIGAGGDLRRAADAAGRRRDLRRGARQVQPWRRRQGQRGRYQGLTFLSPNMNIFRDPRWGRGHETFGEDPVLTARLGVAFIAGHAGRRPALPQDGRDGEALRRAQRARGRPAQLRRARQRRTIWPTPTCRSSRRPCSEGRRRVA